jgi:cyclophilin family peptidyl-prolyl cis-trans isomerase
VVLANPDLERIIKTVEMRSTPVVTARSSFATSAGDFVVEVYPDKAPKTVENFLQYVKDKHYDGTIFHRVINNFMVQGGGFDKELCQKPTRPRQARRPRSLGQGRPAQRGRHAGHGPHQ